MERKNLKVVLIEENDMLREKIAGLISRMENVMLVCQANSVCGMKGVVEGIKPDVLLVEESCIFCNEDELNSMKEQVVGLNLVLMVEDNGDNLHRCGMVKNLNLDAIINKKKIHGEFADFLNSEYR